MIVLTGRSLTLDEVIRVARAGARVQLDTAALETMRASRLVVERALEREDDVYGLTTGVGMRKQFSVEGDQGGFNSLLIDGHRIGQGEIAAEDIARATMLRLANGLAQGAPGARPELAQLVVDALNEGTRPRIRILGSVGQADLAANADLASDLVGDFELQAGEALALLNNNAFSTALASLAVADLSTLLDALDVAGALDLDAYAANTSFLDRAVGDVRPYPGVLEALSRLHALLDGSSLWHGDARSLQDPLCFRTLPQVHGAARDALGYGLGVLAVELNAHQGNPLVVADGERIVSVGNFDVAPLAAALDFLRIALAPALASASERALKLLQAAHSGLPEGLAARAALAEPGLSELGAAVQALAAEARLLAQPVSYELVSTTQHDGIEDRATMAPLAARRLSEMVGLGARVVAIELTIAAQAIDLRGPRALGVGSQRAYELVRALVPFTNAGEALPSDLQPVVDIVRSGALDSVV